MRRAAAGGGGYDAFISYSHAADDRLASALQKGLHRFAKPWYRVRAVRVFRDEASLAASPHLWTSIEQALDASEFFVLLASPAAAASPWVRRETGYWRERKPIERLLIALCEGEVAWDERSGDFDWRLSDAVPPSLGGAFAEEPRYIDLRWARSASDLSLRDPAFLDAVAELAAPLHGRPKDELHGEDVRQSRRTRRVARAAVAALAILLALAVAAAVVAVGQRQTARTERDRAERQARLALSRQLAAEAIAAGDAELDRALLLAVQAYATMPTAEARTSLLQTLLRSPHLLGVVPGTGGATQLAFGPDGLLAIGRNGGRISLWSPARWRQVRSLDAGTTSAVTSLAFSGDGRRLASGRADGTVEVRLAATGRPLATVSAGRRRVTSVALDRTGGVLATATSGGRVTLQTVRPHRVLRVLRFAQPFAEPVRVAFVPDGNVAITDGQGRLLEQDVRSGAVLRRLPGIGRIIGPPSVSAFSVDARRFAAVWLGRPDVRTPDVFDLTGRAGSDRLLDGPAVAVEAMAFDRPAKRLATAAEGRVTLWSIPTGRALDVPLAGLPGSASAVAFSTDGRFVAASAPRGAAVWQPARLALMRNLKAPGAVAGHVAPGLQGTASAAFSPNGRLLAWSLAGTAGPRVVVWRLAPAKELLRLPAARVVGFSPDGTQLAAALDYPTGSELLIVDLASGRRRRARTLPWPAGRAETQTPTFNQPRLVDGRHGIAASGALDGTVTLRDTGRGQSIAALRLPGVVERPFLAFDRTGRSLAIATAGGTLTIVDLRIETWRATACRLAARTLTPAEWRLFVGTTRRDAGACAPA